VVARRRQPHEQRCGGHHPADGVARTLADQQSAHGREQTETGPEQHALERFQAGAAQPAVEHQVDDDAGQVQG
jgi:hypothetical protein